VLKPYAKEILALMDEARAAVEATAGQAARPLTIGALETIASARMPCWLSAFRGDHPNIKLHLKIGGSGELLQKLEGGDIDIAFCFDKGDRDERFFKRGVSEENLVLVASPDEQPAMVGAGLEALAAIYLPCLPFQRPNCFGRECTACRAERQRKNPIGASEGPMDIRRLGYRSSTAARAGLRPDSTASDPNRPVALLASGRSELPERPLSHGFLREGRQNALPPFNARAGIQALRS
jgi:DNA-binding transcriptional LysR family regulator